MFLVEGLHVASAPCFTPSPLGEMAFLSGLGSVKLKSVPDEDKRDRSGAKVDLAGADVLADEAERWKYFFDTGCSTWFELLKDHTFRSSFVELHREEAEVIVDHWERQRQALAKAESQGVCLVQKR